MSTIVKSVPGGGMRNRCFSRIHTILMSILVSVLFMFPAIMANAATIPLFKTFQNGSIENGVYLIASHDNPKYVLDVTGGCPFSETNVQIYKKNGTQSQQWYLGCVDAKNDIYEIRPMQATSTAFDTSGNEYYGNGTSNINNPDMNHMALDVQNGSTSDGANVQIYAGNGSASQRWKIVKQSDGSYRFWAMNETGNTPFLLNIASDIANSANIQCWHKYDSVVRTKFDLEKVDDGITIVSSKTLEPVDKTTEPIRYSRLQVRDDLQPANTKPVIDTDFTNTTYIDLQSSNVKSKANKYAIAMQDSTKKFTCTWAQVGLYNNNPVGVRLTLDNASQTDRDNSWNPVTLNGQWEQLLGTDHYAQIAYRFAGYKTADEDFLIKLSGVDHKFEFFYTSEYSGKPNATINPIDIKYSIFTSSDMNEDCTGQEGVQAVDKWTGRAYALDISHASSSTETKEAVGMAGRFFYGMLSHFEGTTGFNGSNNAMETSVALQFKGNGMKLRICDTAGGIGYHMEFDSFGVSPSFSFTPGFTKTLDGTPIDKETRNKFSFTAERISAPEGARSFESQNVVNGDNGFYIDEKPQYIEGDYVYKITENQSDGYTTASPFYLKESIGLDDDDKMIGTLYSSEDGKNWTELGDSNVTANNYAYKVNNVTKSSSISLKKTPDTMNIIGNEAAPGTKIGYTFLIKNTGEQSLHDITLTDEKLDDVPSIDWGQNSTHILAPGESVTAAGTYTLETSDLENARDNGTDIINVATVTAKDANDKTVTSSWRCTVMAIYAASLNVTKTVSNTSITTGDQSIGKKLTYTIKVKNTGNQIVSGIAINDSLKGLSTLSIDWNGNTKNTISPASTITATGTYTITRADVDAGEISNTAYATGTDKLGKMVQSNNSTATTTISGSSELSLEKAADISSITADEAVDGKTIRYTIKVTNTGTSDINDIKISDPLVSSGYITPNAATLSPGESTTASASYQLQQSDIDAGKVINTAIATGTDRSGTPVTSNEGTATTMIETPNPKLTVEKTSNKQLISTNEAHIGTVIAYTISVTNIGNTTIRNAEIVDSMTYDGAPSLTIDEISPGETKQITARHALTQNDIDSGTITNTCFVRYGKHNTTTTSTSTKIERNSGLSLTKDVDIKQISADEAIPGKRLTYTMTIKNTGTSTIHGISINDQLTGTKVGAIEKTTLTPNETTTATATYDITENDIERGSITNTATAAGRDSGDTQITSNTATAKTDITTPKSNLSIMKTVNKSSLTGDEAKAGTKLHYAITVSNNGNTTINGISVSDRSQAGPATVSLDKTTLAPSETANGSIDYSITQADIDRGTVSNTASATGQRPNGTQISTKDSTAITTIQQTSGLTIEKTVDKTSIAPASAIPGTKITYSFTVKNTGTTSIKNVSVADSMSALGAIKLDKTALAPNETTTGTATYAITQSDIGNKKITNTAYATGTDIDGNDIASTDSTATTTITAQKTGLILEKTVDKAQLIDDGAKVGAELAYGFKITNAGNIKLTNVSIVDTLDGLSSITMTWPRNDGTLEAGETAIGTAKYTVRQSDIDSGNITNTAKATGTNATTGDKVQSNTAKATTGIDRKLKIIVSKTADPTEIGASKAIPGTNISYAIGIKNAGNTTIGITATDSMTEIGNITLSKTTLAPNETATATANHKITAADIEAGTVSNTVSATGTTTDGTMSVSGKSTATTTIEQQKPKLTLEKTVDKESLSKAESHAGAKLTYSFKLTNTGNVPINGISIDDELQGLSDIKMSYSKTNGELAPGESATGTATYTLQLYDIANSYVTNTATATGKNKTTGAAVTSNQARTTTQIARNMAMKLEKTSNPSSVKAADAISGKEIEYTFKITNTGNTTLSYLTINDEMKEIGTINLPENSYIDPGKSITATAKHKLTQTEINAGQVINTATAKGGIPDIGVSSNEATVTTPIEKPISKLTLEKTVDKSELAGDEVRAGMTLTYTFKLTNGGNIPISNINIDDKLPGLSNIDIDWKGSDKTIPAGSSITGTATYNVTQEDIDAGAIENTATATGTDTQGNTLTASSNAATSIKRNGKLETTKTADKTSITGDEAKPGTIITYKIKVTNTGNVTLHNITCDDSMKGIGKVSLDKTELAPDETATGTATHVLTQADIDTGFVKNTASSSADSPDSLKVVSNESSISTTVSQNTQLEVEKTADITHIAANDAIAGKKITYSLKITNTGNATITGTELNDELVKDDLSVDWNGSGGHTLTPGQSVTAKATYKITGNDIDNGIIENVAFATGQTTNGKTVKSNTAKTTTTIEKAQPSLSIVKTGTKQVSGDDAKPGYEIEFDFDIENNGNTDLNDIRIDDELTSISDITLDKTELAAGEKTKGKTTYKITQTDIDAGIVKNIAIASATAPNGDTIKSNESEHDVTIDSESLLSIEKNVDRKTVSGTESELKQTTLTYSFIIRNTGTTTVSNVKIADSMKGLSNITFGKKKTASPDENKSANADKNDNGNAGTADNANSGLNSENKVDALDESKNETKDDKGEIILAPGEEIDATATYTIADDDIKTGHITNTAHATGKAPNDDRISSAESEATTQIEKIDEQQPQQDISSDLMQTGIGIAIPSLMAFIGIGSTVLIRRKRRTRR